ncbi:HEAT repeat-containing protein 1-like [Biomphalaria glabrata]|uniref:HEAT repeat-containing protein 1 n=1 Tax=Biomphalaria glabrata TaxID=6526 RepID=A0A9U8EBD7_BIOGL|nr:HEAT repeat-containing protein 1-like [Biomphalaria glabrata]XP_055885908.1 HEAT repeat-containing protein 1-like [Biomphalaria glabrata]
MTSLAAQLRQLAVPETQILLSGDLKQASFLYDEGEAAKFDKQHFYNIGINGLQQLIEKDARFMVYEHNLFSPSSQTLQRYVQTSDVNKKLDDTINTFLLMLSPYMQLREAHKAMEWMVHRYNVHLRNVDVLMMSVLPYHDQQPFVMALRLLKMNSNECIKWKWLEPVKKGGSFLPRQTLIQHCKSVKGFLGFICNMLQKHIEANTDDEGNPSARHLQRVVLFYTQIITGTLQMGPPSETMLSTLLPAITVGLKSQQLPELVMSSYMILVQIVAQTSLANTLLESLVNVIAKNVEPSLLKNAVTVLTIMYQRQNITRIPKKAFKYLCRHASLKPILAGLDSEAKIEPFLCPFMQALTKKALKEVSVNALTSDSNPEDNEDVSQASPMSLLIEMLTTMTMEKDVIIVIFRVLLTWFVQQRSGSSMEVEDYQVDAPFRLFRILENRFSTIVESIIQEAADNADDPEMQEVIRNLLEKSATSAQQDLNTDPTSNLIICLYHRHSIVRKQAVERLLQDVNLLDDKASVQSALALRLQDTDPTVVAAVLNNPLGLWELFEDKVFLYQTLLKKLQNIGSEKNTVRDITIKALCYLPDNVADEIEITGIIMSYFLPAEVEDMELLQNILNSSLAGRHSLLIHLKKHWQPCLNQKIASADDMASLFVKLIDALTSYIIKGNMPPDKFVETLYTNLHVSSNLRTAAFIILCVCEHLIQTVTNQLVKSSLQRLTAFFISDLTLNKHIILVKNDNVSAISLSQCLSVIVSQDHIPMSFFVPLLDKLAMKSVLLSLKDANFWMLSTGQTSVESNWLQTIVIIFSLMFELLNQKKSVPHELAKTNIAHLQQLLRDPKDMLKFLCMVWMASDNQGVSTKFKAETLQFSQVFLKSLSAHEKETLLTKCLPVLPCLLILLSSQFEKVREMAVNMLELLTKTASASSHLLWFSGNLLKYKQEVTKDNEFLSQVLTNILEGELASCESPAKKRKRTSSALPVHLECVDFFMKLISDTTPCSIKCGLLAILSRLDTVESFEPLIPVLKNLLDLMEKSNLSHEHKTVDLSVEQKELVSLLIKRFTSNVAGCIGEKSECLQTLLKALKSSFKIKESGDTVQMLLLKQLSGPFLAAVPLSSRQAIFTELLTVLSTTSNPEVGRLCKKVVKHMTLDSVIVIEELKTVLTTSSPGTIREAKKQKLQASGSDENSEFDKLHWKRIVLLFEMIQIKKKISNAVPLIPAAFQVLGRVLELEHKGSGEYFKQLILGTINFICSRHQKHSEENDNTDSVKGEHLNMELIVNCVRSSDNPHTHQQALMLLSTAAKIAPGLLLHNMMTVFTFMGANILRQDDAYSFHVIGKILENVIPALILACQEKSKDNDKKKKSSKDKIRSEEMMTVILRVFVDAIPHIPSHRKIVLFEKLMSILGADRYLWRLILLFIESVTVRSKTLEENQVTETENEKSSGPLNLSDLEFLSSIVEKFSCTQLFQCYQLSLSYVLELPEEKQGIQVLQFNKESLSLEDMSSEDMEIFSISHHSAKQLRHFKFATVYALNEFICSQHLVAQMAVSDPSVFLNNYQSLLETVLKFIGQVTESSQRLRESNSSRFWRILLNKSHDVLDNLVNLLPDSMFMDVVSGLMNHSLPLVQRRAMELLNNKLQHYKENLTPAQIDMLITMTTKLISIASQCLLKGKTSVKEENLVNGQTALYSLKVLCRVLGDKHEHLTEILQLCIKVLSRHTDNGMVCASSLLCVAEAVSSLKLHSIEFLTQFMPLVIDHLKSPAITEHEVLLLAAITSLQKIVESMSAFLSPFLVDIIVQVCLISSNVESQSDAHKPTVIQKIKLICSTLSVMTPTRTFLPGLEKSFTALEDKFVTCAEYAMTMLKDHIVKMSKDDLTTFSPDLLKFFFACFDLRATHNELSDEDLNVIEGCIIEAFVCLVFKLSEAQFKPMLLQIYNWATDENVNKKRLIVFYRLCDSLAGKLKNLFTLFAGHIIKHSADMLDTNNRSKQKCKLFGKGKAARAKVCGLLVHIIDCLQKTFAHDTEGFLTKERFDTVMQSLVDQLENTLGKPSVCEDRILNHVVPCIASLAAAAHDDSLWKDLNYQILLKTRHENFKVRIWALAAIDAFHKQLGEDYTQLVPETIPFMAELMEDEHDEVEKLTQKVLAAMEVSVGENLQEYF